MKKYILILVSTLFLNSGVAFSFISPDDIKPEKTSKQAIENLIDIFEKAIAEEDIDLLDTIILPSKRDELLEPFEDNFRNRIYLSFKITSRKIMIHQRRAIIGQISLLMMHAPLPSYRILGEYALILQEIYYFRYS